MKADIESNPVAIAYPLTEVELNPILESAVECAYTS